jgi:hypothetical protein
MICFVGLDVSQKITAIWVVSCRRCYVERRTRETCVSHIFTATAVPAVTLSARS